MKKIIQQAFFQLRNQPLLSVITVFCIVPHLP